MTKRTGYRPFNLRCHQEGKQNEVRKEIMMDMRELSKLFLKFQSVCGSDKTVEDMFDKDNLTDLIDCIQEIVRVIHVNSPNLCGRKTTTFWP